MGSKDAQKQLARTSLNGNYYGDFFLGGGGGGLRLCFLINFVSTLLMFHLDHKWHDVIRGAYKGTNVEQAIINF